jgi:Ca2+-binding RTX toxin-like protein
MIINLIPDSSGSVSTAPNGFKEAVQAAANIFDQTFIDNITINIVYGWGTLNGVVDPGLTNSPGAEAKSFGDYVAYSTVKSWLTADARSSDDSTAVGSLPSSMSTSVFVGSAQEKALGHFLGNTGSDGAIGFGTASSSSSWQMEAIHEIAHAMGRMTAYYEGGVPTIMDLYRYGSPGHFQWAGGQPAYLSIDGGVTKLANFDTGNDYGDFAVDSLTPNDPFDWSGASVNTLTSLDIRLMDVLGFSLPIIFHCTPGNDSISASGTYMQGFADDGNNDQIYFTGSQNQLFGGTGNDWLGVSGNNNALSGGSGNNWMGATGNSNTLAGGSGNSTLFAAGSGNFLFAQSGNDWLGTSGNQNQLFGGPGADWMGASGSNNAIAGGGGASTLFANGTSNTLSGGSGNDFIGVSGNGNFLYGGSGNCFIAATGSFDTLDPNGGGSDILLAAANAHDHDTFVYHPGDGNVAIYNFVPQVGDQVAIAGFGFTHVTQFAPYVTTSADGSIMLALSPTAHLTLEGIKGGLQDSWFNFHA